MSNDLFNRYSDDSILVPFTSVLRDKPHSFIITKNNLSYGRLLSKSRVCVDKIFTVEKRLVIAKIGKINSETFTKIKSELLRLF